MVSGTGLLTGVEVGGTSLTAVKDGISSDTVNVTVSSAEMTDIIVTPSKVNVAKSQAETLKATAIYSDGTSSDITNSVTWVPADTEVATVSAGELAGVKVGGTTVTATKDGMTSNTVNVTVTDAVITEITVTPAPVKVAKGQTESLTATAIYSDGTGSDVTSSVTWVSADTNTATVVSGTGLLTGVEVGSTSLTAVKDGISSNTVNVSVESALLVTEITVTPSQVDVAKGLEQPLTATATYNDGTKADVTALVTWISTDASTAAVTFGNATLSGNGVGQTTITAVHGGIISQAVDVNVTPAVVTEISLTPPLVKVAKGQTAQLTATAIYSDKTSKDLDGLVSWNFGKTGFATINKNGELSGDAVGQTTLSVTKKGITSNTITVEVTPAVMTDITVTPPLVSVAKGQSKPLKATAIYSDNSSSNETKNVTWISADTSTATVEQSTGVLTGVEENITNITATLGSFTSNTVNVNVTPAVITKITVTPSQVNVAKGQTEPLTATALYSDGTSAPVTNSVTWSPVDSKVTVESGTGKLKGKELGETSLIAEKDGIKSNTVKVNVTAAVITKINVTPLQVDVAKGQKEPLTATAIYSDGTSANVTDKVTWISADTSKATVEQGTGLLTGVVEGNTTVTATLDKIKSDTANVKVTAAVITAITLTPSPVVVANGQEVSLMATAKYSDGTSNNVSKEVTWIIGDTNVATAAFGDDFLTGTKEGRTTLTASKDGVNSNEVTVRVTAAVITAINVMPSSVKVAKGQTVQLMAEATFSDGSKSNLSKEVTWDSADNATATVSPAGELTGVEIGSTTITASKDGVNSNTVNIEVTVAVITAIQVTPSPVNVANGLSVQLTAMATLSDGTLSDVSGSVTWIAVNTTKASVTPAGLLTGNEVGDTTLTAIKDGVTSSIVNVEVTAAIIVGITVEPSSVTVGKGLTEQLTATATLSDGTSSDVTNEVTWTTEHPDIAVATPDGVLSGVEVGSTSLEAVKDGITSNTVNVDVVCNIAGECIDFADISGTLYANSPSVPFLNSIGGSAHNGEHSARKGGLGKYRLFNYKNANTLCDTYSTQKLGGRTNWRLPTKDELVLLVNVYGDMAKARSWPNDLFYLSQRGGSTYTAVNLSTGNVFDISPTAVPYASCVSNP